MFNIAFTNEPDPPERQIDEPCPSTVRRSRETIEKWPGNKPKSY